MNKIHAEINQMAPTVGLAQVRKSVDFANWPRWAVIYPDSTSTEWFKSELAAEYTKNQFNNKNG